MGYVVVCRGEDADKLQRARAKEMKSSERRLDDEQIIGRYLSLISAVATVGYLPQRHKVGQHGVEGPDVRQTICASQVSTAQCLTVRAAYWLFGGPLPGFNAAKYEF